MISPLLFKFYINEVIDTVLALRYGCSLRILKINKLCYADDIVLLAPTAPGLHWLEDCLSDVLRSYCSQVNVEKNKTSRFQSESISITSMLCT